MIRGGAAAGRARAGVVLLHGRGGSAADILGLLEAAALPDVAGLAPEAPGRSWWPTSFLAPTAQMEAPLRRALAAVAEAVAAFRAEGLPADRIWLAGFSQGACLALEAFARQGAGLAGVFGFSGGLVGTADAPGGPQEALYGHGAKAFAYPERRDGARVWISVHERDPHIPLARAQDSARVLADLGATTGLTVHPGPGHSLRDTDLAAFRAALNGA